MTEAMEQPTLAAGEAARHRALEDDVRGLVDSGLAYARAELELQRARAGYAAGRIKWIALLGVGALLLVFFAFVALTVGLVFTLAPFIGPFGATLVVFAALLVCGGIAGYLAARQWRQMMAALANPGAR